MSQELWTAVDAYFEDLFIPADAVLDDVVAASDAAGMPRMNVAANQGKLLMLIAQIHGSRRILEFGTMGGYSTIWLARALPPDGHLITLEYDPNYAAVAAQNIVRAGLQEKVDIRVGAALDTLPKLAAEGHAPFDFIFIDADKQSNPQYFEWALKLSRPGSIIIVDNVVRDGQVIEPENDNPSVQGTRRFAEMAATEPRVSATAIQTVGSKGYDGFALLRVVD